MRKKNVVNKKLKRMGHTETEIKDTIYNQNDEGGERFYISSQSVVDRVHSTHMSNVEPRSSMFSGTSGGNHLINTNERELSVSNAEEFQQYERIDSNFGLVPADAFQMNDCYVEGNTSKDATVNISLTKTKIKLEPNEVCISEVTDNADIKKEDDFTDELNRENFADNNRQGVDFSPISNKKKNNWHVAEDIRLENITRDFSDQDIQEHHIGAEQDKYIDIGSDLYRLHTHRLTAGEDKPLPEILHENLENNEKIIKESDDDSNQSASAAQELSQEKIAVGKSSQLNENLMCEKPSLQPVECKICGSKLKYQKNLKVHMNIHTREFKQICDYCGKEFIKSGDLKRHRKTHFGERNHQCQFCERAFFHMYQLQAHMAVHTIKERKHKCELCGKSYKYIRDLRVHFRIHTGENKFHECTICKKLFGRSFNLKSHMALHSNEKFKCEFCEQTFMYHRDMANHMAAKHEESKIHQCIVCHKIFDHKYKLSRHIQLHVEEKRCKCDACGKCFRLPFQLKTHQKVHQEETLGRICPICGNEFKYTYKLKFHLSKIHGVPETSFVDVMLQYKEKSLSRGHGTSFSYEEPFDVSAHAKRIMDDMEMEDTAHQEQTDK